MGEPCTVEHTELFRRFIRHAVVARNITMRDLLRSAGVSHEAVRYSHAPRFLTVVCLLQALREHGEFSAAEKLMFLGCVGMEEEVDIEEVDLAVASQNVMRFEKRGTYGKKQIAG